MSKPVTNFKLQAYCDVDVDVDVDWGDKDETHCRQIKHRVKAELDRIESVSTELGIRVTLDVYIFNYLNVLMITLSH